MTAHPASDLIAMAERERRIVGVEYSYERTIHFYDDGTHEVTFDRARAQPEKEER